MKKIFIHLVIDKFKNYSLNTTITKLLIRNESFVILHKYNCVRQTISYYNMFVLQNSSK